MKTVLAIGTCTTERPFCIRHCFNISPLTEILLIHRQCVGLYERYDEDLGITAEKNNFLRRELSDLRKSLHWHEIGKKVIEGEIGTSRQTCSRF